MLLIALSCAWVCGIFLGSLLRFPPAIVLSGLIPLCLLFFFKAHKSKLIAASLVFFTFFGGALYYQSTLPIINESHLQYYNHLGEVEIRGTVARPQESSDKASQLRLSTNLIKIDGEWQAVSGNVLLFSPLYSGYRYGDTLQVKGKLEAPHPLGDFDYPGYLAHQGIYSVMLYPQVEVLERDKGIKFLAWIYAARERLAQSLEQVLPEPQASLAQGILLGMRGNIPQSVRDDFTASGTAHILAISGQNLSIIAGMLISLGAWLFGRRHGIYVWLALSAICFTPC